MSALALAASLMLGLSPYDAGETEIYETRQAQDGRLVSTTAGSFIDGVDPRRIAARMMLRRQSLRGKSLRGRL
jgi:predicted aconitase with swiveling domain